jgi:ribosomal protein S18 acetylase RimI-like enzyme
MVAHPTDAPALEIRPYRESDEADVVGVWERAGLVSSADDHAGDIREKLTVQRELFLVGIAQGRVVGTVMAGFDGHRGWIHRLAVEPDLQSGGLGRQLLDAAESGLRALGCSKVNLQVRAGNERVVGFYEKLGYVVEDRVSMGKRFA